MYFTPFSVNVLFFAMYCLCERVSKQIYTLFTRTAQIASIHNVAVARFDHPTVILARSVQRFPLAREFSLKVLGKKGALLRGKSL